METTNTLTDSRTVSAKKFHKFAFERRFEDAAGMYTNTVPKRLQRGGPMVTKHKKYENRKTNTTPGVVSSLWKSTSLVGIERSATVPAAEAAALCNNNNNRATSEEYKQLDETKNASELLVKERTERLIQRQRQEELERLAVEHNKLTATKKEMQVSNNMDEELSSIQKAIANDTMTAAKQWVNLKWRQTIQEYEQICGQGSCGEPSPSPTPRPVSKSTNRLSLTSTKRSPSRQSSAGSPYSVRQASPADVAKNRLVPIPTNVINITPYENSDNWELPTPSLETATQLPKRRVQHGNAVKHQASCISIYAKDLPRSRHLHQMTPCLPTKGIHLGLASDNISSDVPVSRIALLASSGIEHDSSSEASSTLGGKAYHNCSTSPSLHTVKDLLKASQESPSAVESESMLKLIANINPDETKLISMMVGSLPEYHQHRLPVSQQPDDNIESSSDSDLLVPHMETNDVNKPNENHQFWSDSDTDISNQSDEDVRLNKNAQQNQIDDQNDVSATLKCNQELNTNSNDSIDNEDKISATIKNKPQLDSEADDVDSIKDTSQIHQLEGGDEVLATPINNRKLDSDSDEEFDEVDDTLNKNTTQIDSEDEDSDVLKAANTSQLQHQIDSEDEISATVVDLQDSDLGTDTELKEQLTGYSSQQQHQSDSEDEIHATLKNKQELSSDTDGEIAEQLLDQNISQPDDHNQTSATVSETETEQSEHSGTKTSSQQKYESESGEEDISNLKKQITNHQTALNTTTTSSAMNATTSSSYTYDSSSTKSVHDVDRSHFSKNENTPTDGNEKVTIPTEDAKPAGNSESKSRESGKPRDNSKSEKIPTGENLDNKGKKVTKNRKKRKPKSGKSSEEKATNYQTDSTEEGDSFTSNNLHQICDSSSVQLSKQTSQLEETKAKPKKRKSANKDGQPSHGIDEERRSSSEKNKKQNSKSTSLVDQNTTKNVTDSTNSSDDHLLNSTSKRGSYSLGSQDGKLSKKKTEKRSSRKSGSKKKQQRQQQQPSVDYCSDEYVNDNTTSDIKLNSVNKRNHPSVDYSSDHIVESSKEKKTARAKSEGKSGSKKKQKQPSVDYSSDEYVEPLRAEGKKASKTKSSFKKDSKSNNIKKRNQPPPEYSSDEFVEPPTRKKSSKGKSISKKQPSDDYSSDEYVKPLRVEGRKASKSKSSKKDKNKHKQDHPTIDYSSDDVVLSKEEEKKSKNSKLITTQSSSGSANIKVNKEKVKKKPSRSSKKQQKEDSEDDNYSSDSLIDNIPQKENTKSKNKPKHSRDSKKEKEVSEDDYSSDSLMEEVPQKVSKKSKTKKESRRNSGTKKTKDLENKVSDDHFPSNHQNIQQTRYEIESTISRNTVNESRGSLVLRGGRAQSESLFGDDGEFDEPTVRQKKKSKKEEKKPKQQ